MPGGSCRSWYLPWASEVVVRVKPLVGSVAVTVALAMAAPEGSRTTPLSCAVEMDWAAPGGVRRGAAAQDRRAAESRTFAMRLDIGGAPGGDVCGCLDAGWRRRFT